MRILGFFVGLAAMIVGLLAGYFPIQEAIANGAAFEATLRLVEAIALGFTIWSLLMWTTTPIVIAGACCLLGAMANILFIGDMLPAFTQGAMAIVLFALVVVSPERLNT